MIKKLLKREVMRLKDRLVILVLFLIFGLPLVLLWWALGLYDAVYEVVTGKDSYKSDEFYKMWLM